MSKENLEQFMSKVADSEELQAKIGEEIDAEALIALGAECGCEFTAEELQDSAAFRWVRAAGRSLLHAFTPSHGANIINLPPYQHRYRIEIHKHFSIILRTPVFNYNRNIDVISNTIGWSLYALAAIYVAFATLLFTYLIFF